MEVVYLPGYERGLRRAVERILASLDGAPPLPPREVGTSESASGRSRRARAANESSVQVSEAGLSDPEVDRA